MQQKVQEEQEKAAEIQQLAVTKLRQENEELQKQITQLTQDKEEMKSRHDTKMK